MLVRPHRSATPQITAIILVGALEPLVAERMLSGRRSTTSTAADRGESRPNPNLTDAEGVSSTLDDRHGLLPSVAVVAIASPTTADRRRRTTAAQAAPG